MSLIVPAYNMWILTLNCLRSLVVAEHGAAGFEVILADDASSDETPQIVERNPWLRHVRLERNSGFIDNCNHAAEAARGELLLFLNNDILVGDGWLGALLASLRRYLPGAGGGRPGAAVMAGCWRAAASSAMAMCGTTVGVSGLSAGLSSTMSVRWITSADAPWQSGVSCGSNWMALTRAIAPLTGVKTLTFACGLGGGAAITGAAAVAHPSS